MNNYSADFLKYSVIHSADYWGKTMDFHYTQFRVDSADFTDLRGITRDFVKSAVTAGKKFARSTRRKMRRCSFKR